MIYLEEKFDARERMIVEECTIANGSE